MTGFVVGSLTTGTGVGRVPTGASRGVGSTRVVFSSLELEFAFAFEFTDVFESAATFELVLASTVGSGEGVGATVGDGDGVGDTAAAP